jgi:nucleoside-diphosphate-sugar epimerase
MNDLRNAAVLVAGGAGFVGSALVRELLSHGAEVVSLDNYFHGHPHNLQGVAGPLTLLHGDVLECFAIRAILDQYSIDYIFNCVGDTFVPTAYHLPQRFFDINLQGTLNLLSAATECGVRRVLCVSSTEVYGDCGREKLSEATPLNPVNTYAVSKLAADRLCFTWHLEHGLPIVIARLFNCYGPRETHPYIVPEIISQLSKGPCLYLGNVEAERDLTFVHDTARALIALLESEVPDGEAVNIGSGNCYSVEWLAYELASLMGVDIVEINRDQSRVRKRDINCFRCDSAKLQAYTGWQPHVPIHEGLQRTVEWFRAMGCRWPWEYRRRDIGLCATAPTGPSLSSSSPTPVILEPH